MKLADSFSGHAGDRTGVHIAFVDNSDGDDRGDLERRLHSLQPSITVWNAPGNLGYFGGARYGLERAIESGADPDWVVISNVDLSFDPAAVARALVRHDWRTVGVVAPAIRSSISGRPLNPFMIRRPPAWRMHAYKYTFRPYWGLVGYIFVSDAVRRLRRLIRSPRTADEVGPREIYAPHGAFIAISRALLAKASPLDHKPFLFGEEITVAESARCVGMAVIYDPSIEVLHAEHASTAAMPSRKRHAYLREAAAYRADTFFGRTESGDR